jgi:hypothetical protein
VIITARQKYINRISVILPKQQSEEKCSMVVIASLAFKQGPNSLKYLSLSKENSHSQIR